MKIDYLECIFMSTKRVAASRWHSSIPSSTARLALLAVAAVQRVENEAVAEGPAAAADHLDDLQRERGELYAKKSEREREREKERTKERQKERNDKQQIMNERKREAQTKRT